MCYAWIKYKICPQTDITNIGTPVPCKERILAEPTDPGPNLADIPGDPEYVKWTYCHNVKCRIRPHLAQDPGLDLKIDFLFMLQSKGLLRTTPFNDFDDKGRGCYRHGALLTWKQHQEVLRKRQEAHSSTWTADRPQEQTQSSMMSCTQPSERQHLPEAPLPQRQHAPLPMLERLTLSHYHRQFQDTVKYSAPIMATDSPQPSISKPTQSHRPDRLSTQHLGKSSHRVLKSKAAAKWSKIPRKQDETAEANE